MLLHTTGAQQPMVQAAAASGAAGTLPQIPPAARVRRPGRPSLDELLRHGATSVEADAAPDLNMALSGREAFGVFFGLRAALVVYVGLGVAAGVAYEVWTMLGL